MMATLGPFCRRDNCSMVRGVLERLITLEHGPPVIPVVCHFLDNNFPFSERSNTILVTW